MLAEEPVMFPAIEPLRDLDRFSKPTYPIDSKLVDGQQATAPMKQRMKQRIWLWEPDYFAIRKRRAPIDALGRGAIRRNSCAKIPNSKKASNSALTNTGKVRPIDGLLSGDWTPLKTKGDV